MKTEIIKIDTNNIEIEKISYAANILKSGGLVAFPTETVYGLGANALNELAVKGIFAAKGRPADNPLIVHVAHKCQVGSLISHTSNIAEKLMDKFWPGPLTLIMPKSNIIPPIITAGLETVAIRMPSHPVALALIKKAGIPVAAPSANTSGRPSPTKAEHVIDDLFGKIDVIIDASTPSIGIESTVLDIMAHPPTILRPGGITLEMLENSLGKVALDPSINNYMHKDLPPMSPGMKYKHYAPLAKVIIIKGNGMPVVDRIRKEIDSYREKGLSIGVLATDQTRDFYNNCHVISLGNRDNPESIASRLFGALREFDKKEVDIILAESIEDTGIGFAVMNRLSKAAGYNIINVV